MALVQLLTLARGQGTGGDCFVFTVNMATHLTVCLCVCVCVVWVCVCACVCVWVVWVCVCACVCVGVCVRVCVRVCVCCVGVCMRVCVYVWCVLWLTFTDESLPDKAEHDAGTSVTFGRSIERTHNKLMNASCLRTGDLQREWVKPALP